MSKDIPLKQEDFFYDLVWDENIGSMFVDVLADQARMGAFTAGGDNKHAIQTAQYFVNKFFNNNFDLQECVKQTHRLQKRHATFSRLMLRGDIFWAKENNELNCEEATWSKIIKEDPFAQAYATYGDPHWDDLQVIFGLPTSGAPPPRLCGIQDVVQVSDDVNIVISKNITPLNEVILISSDKDDSLSTNFWKELQKEWDDSDDEGSFRSPSLKTEMSSTNHNARTGKGKVLMTDNSHMVVHGSTYGSSSALSTPNSKK